MNKQKLYFLGKDDEMCFTLQYHLDNAKSYGLTEVELFEAIPDKSKEYFWCKSFDEVTMSEDNMCGKHCDDYAPRNGKSGICKFKSHCHTWGEKIKFKVPLKLTNNQMTRAELILSTEYLEATIEVMVLPKKSIRETRKELIDWIIKYRNEYATELIIADRKDAAEKATIKIVKSCHGCECIIPCENKVIDKDSITNRPMPEF